MERQEIEAVIGEVARKHNLLLSADDPLLITVTLNEMILLRIVDKLREAIEAAQDQVSAGGAEQIETAKQVAGSIVTGAADYVAGQARLAIDALREELLAAAAAERQKSSSIAVSALQAQHSAWIAATIAMGLACLLSGIVIGLSFDIGFEGTPNVERSSTRARILRW